MKVWEVSASKLDDDDDKYVDYPYSDGGYVDTWTDTYGDLG